MWSLGVLLYNMIYGDIPFEQDNDIVNCNLDFDKCIPPGDCNQDCGEFVKEVQIINGVVYVK